MKKSLIKTIMSHLEGDIKGYREESDEDRELMKKLRGKKKKSSRRRRREEDDDYDDMPGEDETEVDEQAESIGRAMKRRPFKEPLKAPRGIRYPQGEPHAKHGVTRREIKEAGSNAHMKKSKDGDKEDRKRMVIAVIKKKMKKQGSDDREDESLGMRRGKESGKKQSYKDRRDESRGMRRR